jgi:hypothetical protein
MTKRRTPIDTVLTSTVTYPSSLFSLEKDAVFPYERFAYNLLVVGVEALHRKNLPERLLVDFAQLESPPWSINSSIALDRDNNGAPVAFHFVTPQLVPAIVYMFTAVIVCDFLDEAAFEKFRSNPKALGDRIRLFVDAANAGARAYLNHGFGSAIRASYDHLALKIWDLDTFADHYDSLTKLIANHEVAHGYVQQMTRRTRSTKAETIAFELVADMVATAWLYNKMIRDTPNTEEYRKFRKMNTYAETILSNTLSTLRCQQALLILMAIAGAQRTGGTASLSGGATHPAGLQRYEIQHMQLYTLVRSNFSAVLSKDDLQKIDADWDLRIDVLIRSGVIQPSDLEKLLDPSECDVIEIAANLIEELRIIELEQLVPSLREMRGTLSKLPRGSRNKT